MFKSISSISLYTGISCPPTFASTTGLSFLCAMTIIHMIAWAARGREVDSFNVPSLLSPLTHSNWLTDDYPFKVITRCAKHVRACVA
ncbi:hypothetical protein EV424DRAFT_1408056 [Suillus variegatus]|nr:hypothetical protein EV424DRAFT_1408056 [Suillus variegatus]